MKIAITSDHIPSHWAHSINTLKIAQGFSKLGHDVEVLVVRRFFEDKNNLKIKNIHNFYGINENIRFKYFRDYTAYYFGDIRFKGRFIGQFLNKLTDRLLKNLSTLKFLIDPERRISNYCKTHRIELVFCRRTYNVIYYNILNKIPTILDLHGYGNPVLESIVKLNRSKFFKGIMTLNDFLKQIFIQLGFSEEKIAVMDNCVDLDIFDNITDDKIANKKKIGFSLKKRIILYSGALNDVKGIDTILNAAKLLENENICFNFIGGNQKEIDKWERYIIKNNIKAEVNFLGWKERNELPFYLKAADILLAIYSKSNPTLEYISPIKIIEYMASKTPFIATKIKRTSEICKNNECLFTEIEDPRDLKEKIDLLLSDKNLQMSLVENSYAKAKNFSITERCKRILELNS